MSILDALFGNAVIISGIKDHDHCLQVYVGPRYNHHYVIVDNPDDMDTIRNAWGSTAHHITCPTPPPEALFSDDEPEPIFTQPSGEQP